MSQLHDNTSVKLQISDKLTTPQRRVSKHWYVNPPQRYTGDVFYGNIHGNGFYFIQKENKVFYDGLFYVNKLEGYSHIFYGDGTHFQGLFKDHNRLGPGVLTYPNDEQDVGLWNGFSLARLETIVDPCVIPILGKSVTGKVKLVKYRYLVPVCPNKRDTATEVLNGLEANARVLDNSHKLYNLEVENKNNLFFNKNLFDEKFYPIQDCMIDILVPEEEGREEEAKPPLEEEEESCEGAATDLGRIRQISDELEAIDCRLKSIRAAKYVLSMKVDYCRLCCYGVQGEQSASLFQMMQDDVPHVLPGETGSEFYENPCLENMSSSTSNDMDKSESIVKIESYLGDNCDCQEEMEIDNLDSIERQLAEVERDEIFYETIKRNLQEKLKYHLKKSEICPVVKTKKILVNELLAWNNEELSMIMLRHSFLHRRSEYMVNFNVSTLLKGKRDKFSKPGLHERNCLEFLQNCSRGHVRQLLDTIRINKINVNVCDARGNSGIFFAAANAKIDVIPILVNFGAKLDQLNDEVLTPLALCLLIYLSLRYDRFDWEESFLPELNVALEPQKDVPKWYTDRSLPSINNNKTQSYGRPSQESITSAPTCENMLLGARLSKTNMQEGTAETYFFDTTFKSYKEPKKQGKAKGKKPPPPPPDDEPPSPEMVVKEKSLRTAESTITVLLDYGANPNVGEVPLPPLLLAVFSENVDIVKSILASNAKVDVTMNDDMTALHIIVSLRCIQENIDICRVLLDFDGDANLKTSTNHWLEQKNTVLGKNKAAEDYEDNGKNPLHILCLRKDFPTDTCNYFENLAKMLVEHDIDANAMYLGHTPLSLAVLSGNLNLVETFTRMAPMPIDPHRVLGYNMGNVLTLYILKRYDNILPLEKCKEMLKLLVDLGVNPLRPIDEFENAIAFAEKEHEVIKEDKGKKGGKRGKSSKGSSKKSKKGKKVPAQEVLKEYLKELSRDTIIKYVQLEAVEHLYNLAEANMMKYSFVKILAEFLTPLVALENLATLFNNGRIKNARFNKDICLQVLQVVEKFQKVVKAKKGKKDKKEKKEKKDKKGKKSKASSKSSGTGEIIPPPPTLMELIEATNFEKLYKPKSKIMLKKPGLDETTKYVVCFHCLKRIDKQLLLCPRCQYIYFCSDQCNKLNIKMKAQHNCTGNFYKSQKQRLDAGNVVVPPEDLHQICRTAAVCCEDMLKRKQEEELELQRRLLEEEKKLDIYGTKFLKTKKSERKVSLMSDKEDTSPARSRRSSALSETRLDRRLTSMSLKEEKYNDMVRKKHLSSLKGSEIEVEKRKKKPAKKHSCTCMDEIVVGKDEGESVKQVYVAPKTSESKKSHREVVSSKFEAADVMSDPDHIVRKLRRIPSNYQYFIDLLGNYFPDVDLSFLFLPYACYCNGHLYYKFLDENIFSKTYSMV